MDIAIDPEAAHHKGAQDRPAAGHADILLFLSLIHIYVAQSDGEALNLCKSLCNALAHSASANNAYLHSKYLQIMLLRGCRGCLLYTSLRIGNLFDTNDCFHYVCPPYFSSAPLMTIIWTSLVPS